MNIWFVRCNGETSHNNPRDRDFVSGEPPDFPETEFDYREKCLTEGFARIGWPNTGDILSLGTGRLAPNGYSWRELSDVQQRYLSQFSGIQTGDLILIPADGSGNVHLGVAVRRGAEMDLTPGLPAYFYFHDVVNREWYECAHRVKVRWHFHPSSTAAVHHFTELPWRPAFSRVVAARDSVIQEARDAGLLQSTAS